MFEPDWISHGSRWGLGLSLKCPTCPDNWHCRLELYFLNCCDGLPPDAPPGSMLYYRVGSGLGTITLSPEIDMGVHGRFEIIGGRVVFRLQ